MPVKFDDIAKVATEVLHDDYQTDGYTLKAKQKTAYSGAVVTTQIDFFKDGATPAKLSWKIPVQYGSVKGLSIDKLELDRSGKYKLEASADQVYHGVKLEYKSNILDFQKDSVGCTYTGSKDTQVKFECPVWNPAEFKSEVTHTYKVATVGLKLNSSILQGGYPDFGLRVLDGPFFCSLLANEKERKLNAFYKASSDIKCAATYQQGGKANGAFTVGIVYKDLYKAKVANDQSISFSAKHSIAKGFTFLGGGSYKIKDGKYTMGLQLSIE